MIKYAGPVVIYKIIDPHNYLLMTVDGRLLRGLYGHERLKPANIGNLSQLKHSKCRIANLIIIGNLLKFVYLI